MVKVMNCGKCKHNWDCGGPNIIECQLFEGKTKGTKRMVER